MIMHEDLTSRGRRETARGLVSDEPSARARVLDEQLALVWMPGRRVLGGELALVRMPGRRVLGGELALVRMPGRRVLGE